MTPREISYSDLSNLIINSHLILIRYGVSIHNDLDLLEWIVQNSNQKNRRAIIYHIANHIKESVIWPIMKNIDVQLRVITQLLKALLNKYAELIAENQNNIVNLMLITSYTLDLLRLSYYSKNVMRNEEIQNLRVEFLNYFLKNPLVEKALLLMLKNFYFAINSEGESKLSKTEMYILFCHRIFPLYYSTLNCGDLDEECSRRRKAYQSIYSNILTLDIKFTELANDMMKDPLKMVSDIYFEIDEFLEQRRGTFDHMTMMTILENTKIRKFISELEAVPNEPPTLISKMKNLGDWIQHEHFMCMKN